MTLANKSMQRFYLVGLCTFSYYLISRYYCILVFLPSIISVLRLHVDKRSKQTLPLWLTGSGPDICQRWWHPNPEFHARPIPLGLPAKHFDWTIDIPWMLIYSITALKLVTLCITPPQKCSYRLFILNYTNAMLKPDRAVQRRVSCT